MKKTLLSLIMIFSCLTSLLAIDLPSGYVSIYDLNFETEQCPYSVAGATSYQFVGPPAGWGDLTDHDLSTYKQMVIKLTYDANAAGKQVAIRFAINVGAEAPVIATLPEGTTSHVIRIALEQYKDANGAIGLGGLVFYNGSSHWSFTYDGTANSEAVTVDYIALSAEAPPTTALTNTQVNDAEKIVNVYNISGMIVRKNIKKSEATSGLKKGFYIVDNKKVFVAF